MDEPPHRAVGFRVRREQPLAQDPRREPHPADQEPQLRPEARYAGQPRVVAAQRRAGGGVRTPERMVEQREERDLLTRLFELVGHLHGHDAAEAVPPEQVRAGRLHVAQPAQEMRGDVGNGDQRRGPAVEPDRLEAVDRLLGIEVADEVPVAEHLAEQPGAEEERPPGAAGPQGHDRAPGLRSVAFTADRGGEARDGCASSNSSDRARRTPSARSISENSCTASSE